MMNFKGARAHKFAESPVLKPLLPAWRARLMVLMILGSFVLLIGWAFYLQVLNNEFLQEKGESRYRRELEISASRGRIADRNGDVLAISTPMKSIWAVPADAKLNAEQQKQLARLLEMDVKELSRKLASDRNFVFLRRQLPPEVGERIAALKLPGIGQDKEYRRYYPSIKQPRFAFCTTAPRRPLPQPLLDSIHIRRDMLTGNQPIQGCQQFQAKR